MSAFKRIQRDPDVCNNCFRRTHTRYQLNYSINWLWDQSEQEYEFWPEYVDNGVEIRRKRGQTTKVPASEAGQGMKTTCQCGVSYVPPEKLDEDETWKIRPLGKPMFFEYADRLFDRLLELDPVEEHELNAEVFWDTLDRLKSDPNEQFRDDRLFEKAVEAVLEQSGVCWPEDDELPTEAYA